MTENVVLTLIEIVVIAIIFVFIRLFPGSRAAGEEDSVAEEREQAFQEKMAAELAKREQAFRLEVERREQVFREKVAIELAKREEAFRDKQVERENRFREVQVGYEKAFREETEQRHQSFRGEMRSFQKNVHDGLTTNLAVFHKNLHALKDSNGKLIINLTDRVDANLKGLRTENDSKLEDMRKTVDEKLTKTLNDRLSNSFKTIGEQLERINQASGEMKKMGSDVTQLQKALTGVKTLGNFGEVQLESLLQEVLAPSQYAKEVATKQGEKERVEFAIKLPAQNGDQSSIWLPIDSKFNLTLYQAVQEAAERADSKLLKDCRKRLLAEIRKNGKTIEKYLNPPYTTNYAIMFLPTEGIYQEVLRESNFVGEVYKESRVLITGPNGLIPQLEQVKMAYHRLLVQKHSSEVSKALSVMGREFGNFTKLITLSQGHLNKASSSMEKLGKKGLFMQKQFSDMENLSHTGLSVGQEKILVAEEQEVKAEVEEGSVGGLFDAGYQGE